MGLQVLRFHSLSLGGVAQRRLAADDSSVFIERGDEGFDPDAGPIRANAFEFEMIGRRLAAHPAITPHLRRDALSALLDPANYLGMAPHMVHAVLEINHKEKGKL